MLHGNSSFRASIVWHHWRLVHVIYKAALLGRQVAVPQVSLGERPRVVFSSHWRQQTPLANNIFVREVGVLEWFVWIGRKHQAPIIPPDCQTFFGCNALVDIVSMSSKNTYSSAIEEAASHLLQWAASNSFRVGLQHITALLQHHYIHIRKKLAVRHLAEVSTVITYTRVLTIRFPRKPLEQQQSASMDCNSSTNSIKCYKKARPQ